MQLPDGCYPRLNAALLRSGKFDGMVVSMVGKVLPDGSGFFLCCDQGRIRLDGDQGMIPSDLAATDMVIEVMGLAVDAETVSIFTTRALSVDTDLDVYNKMILQVQHNPKFQHYFVPQGVQMPSAVVAANVSGGGQ